MHVLYPSYGAWMVQGTFYQVSAGTFFTCAIDSSERVQCWGMGFLGPPGQFLQISVAEWHACGVRQDGTVFCWGEQSSCWGRYCQGLTLAPPTCTGRNEYNQNDAPPGEFLQVSAGRVR
jgi:alpha-tubulin suppressor-like RCC1 family protein